MINKTFPNRFFSILLAVAGAFVWLSGVFFVGDARSSSAAAGESLEPESGLFTRGFDPDDEVSWNRWKSFRPVAASSDEEIPRPSFSARREPGVPLETPGLSPVPLSKNPLDIAQAISDTAASLNPAVRDLIMNHKPSGRFLPDLMFSAVERSLSAAEKIRADIVAMHDEIDGMRAALKQNYAEYNRSSRDASTAAAFNARSGEMADRAAAMLEAVGGMIRGLRSDQEIVSGLTEILRDRDAALQQREAYYDSLIGRVKDVAADVNGMAANLREQGLEGRRSFEDLRDYFPALEKYVREHKTGLKDAAGRLKDTRSRFEAVHAYLFKMGRALETTRQNLMEAEQHFRAARVSPAGDKGGVEIDEDAVCAASDVKGLSSLKTCSTDCGKPCRWKEKVGGIDCYECPSGSPDTCWDAGAWPSDHPWCRPGGVCYDDPMLYCAPFATTGPQGEPLNCTNCKQRVDMCWRNVGDTTTTLTNCKRGCWDGTCEYRGRYDQPEWDGRAEWIHCYECVTPPPPPTCEELGWGYDWEDDCLRDCPDPGTCEEFQMPDGTPSEDAPDGEEDSPDDDPADEEDAAPDGDGGDDTGGSDDSGEGTQTGEGSGGDSTSGRPADPPGGTPAQPGSPSAVAGKDSPSQTPETGDTPSPEATPPPEPDGTRPDLPEPPADVSRPEPPEEDPPVPPDNPMISFYRNWLEETRERIRSREDILADPEEGDATRDVARSQLRDMTRDREYLEKRVREEEEQEAEKQRQAEETRRRREEWERSRPRHVDFGEEMRRKSEKWHLERLKEATEELESKAREARESLTNRQNRVEQSNREISLLEREIRHYETAAAEYGMDEDFAATEVRKRKDRLQQIRSVRNELAARLAEARSQYERDIEALTRTYERRLWATDEGARRRAEVTRIDEYYERFHELRDREASRAIRNETFESVVDGLRDELARAEAAGDSGRADEARRQIENVRRGWAEWERTQERQIERIRGELWELEARNAFEGVGPDSAEELAEKLGEYETLVRDQLTAAETAVAKLEELGAKRTPEQNQLLETLRSRTGALRSAADELAAKKADTETSRKYSEEDRARIEETTVRVARGMMGSDADKSFARLFVESLGEETLRTVSDPRVQFKKSVAFSWGIAQGVGSAVKGLVDLGVGGADLLLESAAVNLGYEDGGIFGTDATDTLYGVLDTAGGNLNFDGLTKAAVAAGGAIDRKLTELSRARDVDWATAEFGGKIAGEVVVGEALIAGAMSKGATVLRGGSKAATGVRAADTITDTGRAVNRAADAGTTGTRAASRVDDVLTAPAARPLSPDDIRTAPTGPPSPDDIKTAAASPPLSAEDRIRTAVTDPQDHIRTAVDPQDGIRTAVDPQDGLKTAPEAPPRADASGPRSAVEDVPQARGPPPQTPSTTPPRGGIGPDSQASYRGPDGQTVVLRTGEELGHGSTSVVYAHPTDKTRAIRITEPGRGGIKAADKLDEAGRKAVESLQKPGGPVRIVEPGQPVLVNDPSSPLHGKIVEVVERLENGSADQFLQSQGGRMTESQARAFAEATEELNKNGYAWMDNHTGNYGFEPVPGSPDEWRVVVLDPGGIVPMQGRNLAERASNARALQHRINYHDPDSAAFYHSASDTEKNLFTRIERGSIMDEFADVIDAPAMGILDPYDVAFYPMGTIDFPEVYTRFKP